MDIDPFVVDVPDEVLADLRRRLASTRWPNAIAGIEWEQGTELGYLRELVAYWQHEYDWRTAEARLNRFAHFTTDVDHQRIHFLHVRSPHPDALPLVLTHGWPGSVVEFLDVLDPLTRPPDPADAFHLVVPSLPGYGFSGPTTERGWGPPRIAAAFGTVMERLGYPRYGVQGGDLGSLVSCHMAQLRPDDVVGLHVNFLAFPELHTQSDGASAGSTRPRPSSGGGYREVQRTRPQSIGYLLDDSPAGLASWIVEKFRAWSDCGGDVERSFTKDQLITNVMMYWVTATATSAARLYWEMNESGPANLPSDRVTVPTGIANFRGEVAQPPRVVVEDRFNLVHWSEIPRGGHFAAMEEPELFVDDVRAFFRRVR